MGAYTREEEGKIEIGNGWEGEASKQGREERGLYICNFYSNTIMSPDSENLSCPYVNVSVDEPCEVGI